MTDLGRGEILGPFLLIAALTWLGTISPRLWGFGLTAGVLLLALYVVQ